MKRKWPTNVKQQYRNQIECLVWKNVNSRLLKMKQSHTMALAHTPKESLFQTRPTSLVLMRDWIEYRGRWVGDRNKKVVRKHYISLENKYKDAYVCAPCVMEEPSSMNPRRDLSSLMNSSSVRLFPTSGGESRLTTDSAESWGWPDCGVSLMKMPVNSFRSMMLKGSGNSFKDYFGNHEEPVVKVHLEVIKIGTRLINCSF
jgi:hypothetical protein